MLYRRAAAAEKTFAARIFWLKGLGAVIGHTGLVLSDGYFCLEHHLHPCSPSGSQW